MMIAHLCMKEEDIDLWEKETQHSVFREEKLWIWLDSTTTWFWATETMSSFRLVLQDRLLAAMHSFRQSSEIVSNIKHRSTLSFGSCRMDMGIFRTRSSEKHRKHLGTAIDECGWMVGAPLYGNGWITYGSLYVFRDLTWKRNKGTSYNNSLPTATSVIQHRTVPIQVRGS